MFLSIIIVIVVCYGIIFVIGVLFLDFYVFIVKKMNFIIFDLNILPILVWVVGLFIFWYGIVLCWVFPMYYRSLRSRVLLEYFIFKILFLLKIKKINKNKIISQKRFYYNSYILNCGNKVKTAIVTFDFVQNIRRKLQNVVNPIFGTNHPTNIRIVKNEDNDEKFLLSSNITHGFKNAELFATEGELDESQLYLFNNVNLLPLVDENNNVLIKNVQTALDQLNDDANKVVESISMKLKGNEELLSSLIIFQENVIKTRFSKNIISETSDNLVQSLEYMKNTKSYVKKDPFFIIKDVLENVDSSKID